jgi:hypothetical protein
LEEFGTVDSTVPSTSDSDSTGCNKRATVPPEQKREPTRSSKKETPSDPEAFRKKLKYTGEVAAQGFSEGDAERFA